MVTEGRVAVRWEDRRFPQVFLDEEPLYSVHNAIERCERKIASLQMARHSCIVVFSPLLWLGIDRLLERCRDEHTVVFIELEPLLVPATTRHVPHSLKRAVHRHPQRYLLLFGNEGVGLQDNERGVHGNYQTLTRKVSEILVKNNVQSIESCSLSGGYRLHAAQYRTMRESMQQTIGRATYNTQTLRHMGRLWIRNLLKNFILSKNPHDWKELSTNWPIVVVGAGCSIDVDIQWLKQIAAQVIIVAVDTAVIVLQQHDVPFDIVVVADAQSYNCYDMIGVNTANVIMIADVFAHPSIHNIIEDDQLYWYCSNISSLRLLAFLTGHRLLPTTIPPLGSVGIIAVYLSLNISTNRVFSIGLDCSYVIGKTHARGAPMIQYFTFLYDYLQTYNIDNYTIEQFLKIDHNQIKLDRDNNRWTEIRNPTLEMYESHIAQLSKRYNRYVDCSNNRLNRSIGNRLPTYSDIDAISKSNTIHKINRVSQSRDGMELHHMRSAFVDELYQQLITKNFVAGTIDDRSTSQMSIDQTVIINMLSIDYPRRTDDISPQVLQHCRYSALDYARRLRKMMVARSVH